MSKYEGYVYKSGNNWVYREKDMDSGLFTKPSILGRSKKKVIEFAKNNFYSKDGCVEQLHVYNSDGMWVETTAIQICLPYDQQEIVGLSD